MKKCSKCKEEKPFEEFRKRKTSKDGRRASCKECQKQHYKNNKEKILEHRKQYYENNREKILEHRKQYRENNKEKILEQAKQWRENNKEKILERAKQYRENNKEKIRETNKQYRENNKEKTRERNKQYRENNREKILEYYSNYYKQKRKNDPEFRLRTNIRGAFYRFLNGNKEKSTSEYLKDCGYTRKELMKHLEEQFDQNMTWDNYGSYWHVDHIIPQSAFDYKNDQHIKWCWSLENLRPLEAWENMSKQDNIIPEEIKKISFYEDVKHLLKD